MNQDIRRKILDAVQRIEVFPHGINYKPAVVILEALVTQVERDGWRKGWEQRGKDEDYTMFIGKLRLLKPQLGAFFLLGEIENVAKECKAELEKKEGQK